MAKAECSTRSVLSRFRTTERGSRHRPCTKRRANFTDTGPEEECRSLPSNSPSSKGSGGNWRSNLEILSQGKPDDVSESVQEQLWQAVYEAREEFFRSQFGLLPTDIQKLMNLTCVWPGGGIFAFTATERNGLRFCTSFGLSNADMPTAVGIRNHERTDEGRRQVFTSQLQGRTPCWHQPDRAG